MSFPAEFCGLGGGFKGAGSTQVKGPVLSTYSRPMTKMKT